MARETRPKDYPKLKNYQPTRFMLPTSHYDKAKADRAVAFIENLCHTKGKWAGKRFWLLPWQEQLIRDIFGIVKSDGNRQFRTAFVKSVKRLERVNWPLPSLFIYFMQIMNRLRRFMVQRRTGSRHPLFLMLQDRWLRCHRH